MDAQDRYGDTALHIASCRGFKGVVKELLNHKASREIMNQVGLTDCYYRQHYCWQQATNTKYVVPVYMATLIIKYLPALISLLVLITHYDNYVYYYQILLTCGNRCVLTGKKSICTTIFDDIVFLLLYFRRVRVH